MKKYFYILLIISLLASSCELGKKRKLNVLNKVELNYGEEIEKYASKFEVPVEYLKALTVIECAGEKEVEPRFEPEVFNQLKKVKNNQLTNYENLTSTILKNITEDKLKEMSKSWGPFQIMGYKCVWLGIDLEELKKNSLYWGVVWIDKTYGDYLREGNFKDAFHMHNAGKPFPKEGSSQTYDPDYVDNGLYYMKLFKENNTSAIRKKKEKENKVKISIDLL